NPDGAEVDRARMAKDGIQQPLANAWPITQFSLELGSASPDKVVADVIARRLGTARPLHHALCHLHFLKAATARQFLDDLTVAIACGEVLFGVGAGRILPQHRLDEVGAL